MEIVSSPYRKETVPLYDTEIFLQLCKKYYTSVRKMCVSFNALEFVQGRCRKKNVFANAENSNFS